MQDFKIVSPLIKYLSDKDYIRPFFLDPGYSRKSVILPFSASAVNGNAYYFNADDQLNGNQSTIRAIELVDSVTQTQNPPPSAKDNPAVSAIASGWLAIANMKREVIATIPLYNLIKRLNSGKLYLCAFDSQVWQMCYVVFGDATSITSSIGLQFVVHYDQKGDPDDKTILVLPS